MIFFQIFSRFQNIIPISLICLTLASMASCKTQNEKNPAPQEAAKPLEDSLYNDIIALHDAAMPKMGKLMGAAKVLQQKIDSLDTVTKLKGSQSAKLLKQHYVDLQSQLKAAEKYMMDWMEGFDPDPKFASRQQVIDYFEKQKTSAQKMKDAVFAALDSANAALK